MATACLCGMHRKVMVYLHGGKVKALCGSLIFTTIPMNVKPNRQMLAVRELRLSGVGLPEFVARVRQHFA